MKGSIAIFGGNQKEREIVIQKLLAANSLPLENNPDVLSIEKEKGKSIGIGQIREAIKYVNQKPFTSESKAIVVDKAHLLTTEAQNALLKTLEEPPSYAVIVLAAKNQKSLLETIISRCKRIDLNNLKTKSTFLDEDYEEESDLTSVNNILDMTIGERLTWVEEASKEEKEEILSMLDFWTYELRDLLKEEQESFTADQINLVRKVHSDLETTNVNTRLSLENLVIQLG